MTILGKILVIVNLIFSLVTGALIVMVFVTRTNWKEGYDTMRNRYQAAVSTAQAYANEAQTAKEEADKKVAAIQQEKAQVQGEVVNLKAEVQNKQAEYLRLQDTAKLANVKVNDMTEELNRRKIEVQKFQELVAERDKKLNDLEDQAKKLRDKAVAEEINAKSEGERAKRLLAQLEQTSQNAEPRSPGQRSVGGTALKPPPEDVSGTVLETDAQANLVTISIGIDSGIRAGQTLEIFRLQPKPEYLGTIQIVDTHNHEAVARPVAPLRANRIVKGDRVASRIVTSSRR